MPTKDLQRFGPARFQRFKKFFPGAVSLAPGVNPDTFPRLATLALVFSTADVGVLGWRLGPLADKLEKNNLAAVRILPKRHSELERNQPYVAFIGITPIVKDEQLLNIEVAGPTALRRSEANGFREKRQTRFSQWLSTHGPARPW
jgi:hypothetical protein